MLKNQIIMLDIQKIRIDFPILSQLVNGYPLVYMDNAATTQKPKVVIDSLTNYYSSMNSNIHRGNHTLANQATSAFEETRESVRQLINAKSIEEIIFTRGTTESINLLAQVFSKTYISKGSEIIISTLEHHSNIVPWQFICEEKGVKLKIIPIDQTGTLDLDAYQKLLSHKTALVAINHVSNTLGVINDVQSVIKLAHQNDTPVLLDGAQAIGHLKVDVQQLDCDFYAFSSHKLYGPTGIGILYGKKEFLEAMPPYQGGGEMINDVTFEKITFNDLPYKYEAGTPNISDTIALKEAINYLENLGRKEIAEHEDILTKYLTQTLETIPNLRIIGKAANKICTASFIIKNVHHYDLGTLLDNKGVAIRTGHHCTQPLMNHYNIEGTARASLALYNTKEEINYLAESIEWAIRQLT